MKAKASELRIGNLIINTFKKTNGFPDYIDRVVSLAAYGEINVWSEPINKENGGSKCMMFEGVPLTKEWLLRFGFKFMSMTIDSPATWIKDQIQLKQTESKDIIFHGLQIKHVHQLQNLYFALTGKELLCQ